MKRQSGLSLVELMISIALGLVLIGGVVQVFVSSRTVFVSQQGMSRIQETGRLGMEFIGRDLRMAGYFGCVNVSSPNSPNGTNFTDNITATLGNTTLHKNFSQGLRGYTDSTLPNGFSLGSGFTVKSGSDVLVIRGANEKGMPLSAPNSATTISGFTNETSLSNNCIEGFCSATIGVISDCQFGHFFKVSAVPTLAGNQVTLTHADAWGTALGERYLIGNILPVHTIIYFVATKTGSTTPSLWQKTDNDSAVELLQGVENMSLTYSCESSLACGFTGYQFAASVPSGSWNNVSSVRIELLVQGLDQNNMPSIQPYTFAGQLVTPASTDKTFRQVFNTTFAIRSRFN